MLTISGRQKERADSVARWLWTCHKQLDTLALFLSPSDNRCILYWQPDSSYGWPINHDLIQPTGWWKTPLVNQTKTSNVNIWDVSHVTMVINVHPTFNWCQTSVSKYQSWLTQLHNCHPDIVIRLIGQPQPVCCGLVYIVYKFGIPCCWLTRLHLWQPLFNKFSLCSITTYHPSLNKQYEGDVMFQVLWSVHFLYVPNAFMCVWFSLIV